MLEFAAILLVTGVTLWTIGARRRPQVLVAVKDDEDFSDNPVAAAKSELERVGSLIQGLSPIPESPAEYTGWLEAAMERQRIRSVQKTTGEMLKQHLLVNKVLVSALKRVELLYELGHIKERGEIKNLMIERDRKRLLHEIAQLDAKIASTQNGGTGSNSAGNGSDSGIEDEIQYAFNTAYTLTKVDSVQHDMLKRYPSHKEFIRTCHTRRRSEIEEATSSAEDWQKDEAVGAVR